MVAQGWSPFRWSLASNSEEYTKLTSHIPKVLSVTFGIISFKFLIALSLKYKGGWNAAYQNVVLNIDVRFNTGFFKASSEKAI